MKLISIGEINKLIIFPIIGGFCNFMVNIMLALSKSKLVEYPLILSIGSSMGMSLAGFLVCFYKNNITTKKIENNINKKGSDLESGKSALKQNTPTKSIIWKKIIFHLLNGISDIICTTLVFKYCLDIKINLWVFDILFISLFSYLIFKIKIYRHHYVSIIIIIIIGIILDIIAGHYKNALSNIFKINIKFIVEVVISLYVIIVKYSIERVNCTPQELCFFTGVITFIFFVFLLIFSIYFDLGDYASFFINISKFNISDLFVFLGLIILKFIYNLFIRITIQKLPASQWLIIVVISELAPYILELFDAIDDNNSKINLILIIIGLCFIFFMTLIFNEVIEINCLGLSYNTKRNITSRSSYDLELMEKHNDSFVSEDDYLIVINDD